jgi:hypothetical protein
VELGRFYRDDTRYHEPESCICAQCKEFHTYLKAEDLQPEKDDG